MIHLQIINSIAYNNEGQRDVSRDDMKMFRCHTNDKNAVLEWAKANYPKALYIAAQTSSAKVEVRQFMPNPVRRS